MANHREELNSLGIDGERKLVEVKNKIDNIKTCVRKYGSAIRYHKTKGGPPPELPPLHVRAMFDIVHGNTEDGLVGIGSGVETTRADDALLLANSDDELGFATQVSDDEVIISTPTQTTPKVVTKSTKRCNLFPNCGTTRACFGASLFNKTANT